MVRERGLEPPRVLAHKILSLARLPVPPLPRRRFQVVRSKANDYVSDCAICCAKFGAMVNTG